MRVKIIDACINGRWISMWRNKEVDLYCPDGKRNYWSIENVEREEGSYIFSGNVFIDYELIPQESKLRSVHSVDEWKNEIVKGVTSPFR